jgi:hypothetical protein
MLTGADELHVHQTPEPIAAAGTDRNFYDRSYFGGWTADGATMFAAAFGIYPNLNVADAHLTIVRDGVQHCLHVSKILHSERTLLQVGPIAIEVVEPLQTLRLTVAETEGLGCDLTFTGRHFPIEEPRFIHRIGTRAFMDYTRLSQSTRVTGTLTLDGERIDVGDALGLRDRSWGVRNVGDSDPQPMAPPIAPQFSWAWAPVHLPGGTVFFHRNDDAAGVPWNTRGVVAADGAGAAEHRHASGRLTQTLQPGTRWAAGATITMTPDDGTGGWISEWTPRMHLEMRGIGYFHPRWAHGRFHGEELTVERETITLADPDPNAMDRWHRQVLSDVVLHHDDGRTEHGVGILETLIIGPYAPLGLT